MPFLASAAAAVAAASLVGCGLSPPVDGPVSARYAPEGRYAGHWGVDIATSPGTIVRAPAEGLVTFAGSVAGMRTVTIDHGRVRTSLSYLSVALVSPGTNVRRGDTIGLSGRPHGRAGVHVSVRLDGAYVDPEPWLWCGGGTVRLLPPDGLYSPRRQ